MEVFDINHALRPNSSQKKSQLRQEHKYQFLNYENVLNKPFPHHIKGQYSGIGIQNNLSKILEDQYNSYTASQDISNTNFITQNEQYQVFKDKDRTLSPDQMKNVLNDQLLRITSSRMKNGELNDLNRESSNKIHREKMFSVDLNSILRENPKCFSSRQQSQRSKMLNLTHKRKSDSDSLSFINVEQLSMKEKMKRTFQQENSGMCDQKVFNECNNEQDFRNTIGLSPFKSTFRVRKQQKARSPELNHKRANLIEDLSNDNLNSLSTYQPNSQMTKTIFHNSVISIDDQQEQQLDETNKADENQYKIFENNYLSQKLNEKKRQKRVDLKLPQFNHETSVQQADIHTNKVFNKVLLKAALNRTQDFEHNKSKSLDPKSNPVLRYSQCQPILWVDNSLQQKKNIKKFSKFVNHQMNNLNQIPSSPIKKNNSKSQIQSQLNNSLVIQQTPIFSTSEIKLNYSITYGNNSNLIRRVMQKRQPYWNEISATLSNYQFRWQPTSQGLNFHSTSDNSKYPKVFNHFEFHKHLSDKSLLLFNVVTYCVKNNIEAFEFMPISFYFDFTSEKFEKDLYKFSHIFERLNCFIKHNDYNKHIPSDSEIISIAQNNFQESIEVSKSLHQQKILNKQNQPKTTTDIMEKQIHKQFMQIQETNFLRSRMYENLLSQFNLWVLKPVNLNRGNGITVISSLKEINSAITTGFDLQSTHSNQFNFLPISPIKKNKASTPRNSARPLFNQFILQKYIEKPLLFHGRKFDIRIWVLVTYSNKFQFYQSKEGWVRTSSYKYDLHTTNKYIHLTNNAVQKHSEQYGQFENGNSINYATLKKYINSLFHDRDTSTWDRIQQKIRNIIKITLNSTVDKINLFNREKQFELFGYDFMIDQSFNPWLIEVNTNPCIEESSEVLKQILPRLIDDMLRLTIDQYFNRQQNENKSNFPLKGYRDEELIFDEFGI